MNGIHDMGGMEGFGAVEVERDEPVFHADWERRVFGLQSLTIGVGGGNVDSFRHAIERVPPIEYLRHGYYGRWLEALVLRMREAHVLAAGELEARVAGRAFEGASLPGQPASGPSDARRPRTREPAFEVGDRVTTRDHSPAGHTRLPAYTRRRRGTVAIVHPDAWVLPDSHAHGRGERPEALYAVRFQARELWGERAEPGALVHVDLFESYLERGE